MAETISTAEMCKRHGVTNMVVRHWRDAGMPFTRDGRSQFRFDQDATDEWLRLNRDTEGQIGGDRQSSAYRQGKDKEPDSGPADLESSDPDCLNPSELGRLSVGELKRLQMAEDLVLTRLKRQEAETKLRRSDDVRKAWIEMVRTVSQRLQRMGPEVVDELCQIEGVVIPVELHGRVRQSVQVIIDRHLEGFRERGE